MNGMLKRNLKIYFRDKAGVFFSMFGVLMIVLLYALFLGDVMQDSFSSDGNGSGLMNSWVMAALVASSSITSAMGAFGVMVSDRERKKDRDFFVSPIRNHKIIGAYLLNSVIVSTVMTMLCLLASEIYIAACGGKLLSAIQFLKVFGITVINVLSSCSITGFICTFIHSSQPYTGCSIAVGASIGFLCGVYIPIGQLPKAVQSIMPFLPCSHASALLRQVMTETAISAELTFMPAEQVRIFKEEMGIILKIGGTEVTPMIHIAFLAGSALLFFLLSVLKMSAIKKR